MKELYSLLGISANPSTAYHLRTNRQMERTNWEVERYLWAYVEEQQEDWADWLSLAEFSYNNVVHEATGSTPFYLNHGRHPRRFPTTDKTSTNLATEDLVKALRCTSENIRKAQDRAQKWWNWTIKRRTYEKGEMVYVDARNFPTNGMTWKLSKKWLGPFEVEEKVGKSAYRLKMPEGWRGHPMFNDDLIKKHQGEPPKEKIEVLQTPRAEAEGVVDKRYTPEGVQYKFWWVGWGPEDNSWENTNDIPNGKKWAKIFESQRRDRRRERGIMLQMVTELVRRECESAGNDRAYSGEADSWSAYSSKGMSKPPRVFVKYEYLNNWELD
jgi:hypothetical protein